MNHIRLLLTIYAYFFTVGFCFAQGSEESSIGATDDCTDISIEYKNAENLTPQEKIALMDEAFFDSLNKYERCQNANSKLASSGAGGEDSSASSEMSGMDPSSNNSSMVVNQSAIEDSAVDHSDNNQSKNERAISNGKIPDDIPSVDNDSVLEEQIRQAAMNETDPVIKQKLWNEYRRYKGLPVVRK